MRVIIFYNEPPQVEDDAVFQVWQVPSDWSDDDISRFIQAGSHNWLVAGTAEVATVFR